MLHSRSRFEFAVVAAALILWPTGAMNLTAAPQAESGGESPAAASGLVRVGMLIYGDEQTGVCFSNGFLHTLARTTHVRLRRAFEPVELSSDKLFDYPFVVMTGQRAFTLNDREKEQLRVYVRQGGFVLASAGCSVDAWAQSFRDVMRELFGEDALKSLSLQHAIFRTVYDIDYIDVRGDAARKDEPAIFAFAVDDAVRVVFSPLGLNDTANAGGDCCCCGGSEVRNARLINTNILAYALTH